MKFSEAKNIRDKSFSDTLADKILGGGDIGSSTKQTLSEKTKATAMGIQETPMNLAKAIGGRGLAAILGKVSGVTDETMDYFVGDQEKKKDKAEAVAGEGNRNNLSDSALLNSIFKIMQENRQDDVDIRKKKVTRDRDSEESEQLWHEKLISAISGGKSESASSEQTQDSKSVVTKETPKPKSSSPKTTSRKSSSHKEHHRTKKESSSLGGLVGTAILGVTTAQKVLTTPSSSAEKVDVGSIPPTTSGYIAKEEGLPKGGKAYWDPPGQTNLVSVGYGHQIKPEEYKQGFIQAGDEQVPIKGSRGIETVMTPEQSQKVLEHDLPKYVARAKSPIGDSWDKLDDKQKTALTSYAYNVGSTASLVQQGIKQKIDEGDTEGAASVIRDRGIRTSGGSINKQLVARRAREASVFASGDIKSSGTAEATNVQPKSASVSPVSSTNKDLKDSQQKESPPIIVNNNSTNSVNTTTVAYHPEDDSPIYTRKSFHG